MSTFKKLKKHLNASSDMVWKETISTAEIDMLEFKLVKEDEYEQLICSFETAAYTDDESPLEVLELLKKRFQSCIETLDRLIEDAPKTWK